MHDFEYLRPASLDEARAAWSAADDPVWLAGGQSLLPTLKLRLARPSLLIDLAGLPGLAGVDRTGRGIEIGALARHADVAAASAVIGTIPALARLAGGIGDPQVRNMGTLGGSLAHADPAADYPAAVLGLAATIHTDRRTIAADDYFTGLFETALEPGEVVTRVVFPVPIAAGYARFANPASRFALVGVFVAQFESGVRVAVTGAGPAAFRPAELEDRLGADFRSQALSGLEVAADTLNTDLHATAAYRAALVMAMARRAVESALAP